ncbi:hypothetical protein ACTFIV_001165 [Dictyostelium citrinum]
MSYIPFIDVSVNADWNDWQHYPDGRPNPIYSKQAEQYGLNGLIFGFITLSSQQTPCWAAQPTMAIDWALPLANDIKPLGKNVIISFGGASNREISTSFSVDQLVETYSKVIESYSAYGLDFDLENGLYNVDNISLALKTLISKYPNIQISLTVPTMQSGLTDTGKGLVEAFKKGGFNFIVNGMAMDYYNQEKEMGEAAIKAATSIKDYLKTLYPSLSDTELFAKVAITPMIGLNDDLTMFTIDDAAKVASFAKSNSMAFTSSWNLNRDNPSSFSYVDLTSSSNPDQKEPGEYSKTFVQSK